MSWQEPLDFSSAHVPTSSFHTSSGAYAHSSSPSPFERMSSVERDCCSNFTCCGLHLSDLHSLLEHFEEAHVVVIDNAGNPVFPHSGASDDFDEYYQSSVNTELESDHPAYPYTSIVCGYPQLDPQPAHVPRQSVPVSPLEVESPTPSAHYPLHTFLQHEHATEDSEILADIDTSSVESDNNLNSPSSAQPVALPPSFFVADTSHQRAHSYEHRHHKSYKSRMLGTKLQLYPRRREKTHKCPTPGCSKSYLNPNGLKYHVEKGTCKIEPMYSLCN
ncbi:hypothetical protein PILCRDRAFT_532442 [Piloderma croceum F 1598]|uniref:C2H2-type domain-containing protein n=1 Tax=Piloderma croceum (strain F 1598) TaxID=765440 RepID=A0A0C3B2G4_PILCF|nr:hypothetical protein PILCRDRAFT_532442 [Piloderma croceum F 1598]